MTKVLHQFLFDSGNWVGEGTITFSPSPETLKFMTHWSIRKEVEEHIVCSQSVEMEGAEDHMHNR